jgi:uncharacterized membrane protein/thiol-disulfide isomerase/thioredoxin
MLYSDDDRIKPLAGNRTSKRFFTVFVMRKVLWQIGLLLILCLGLPFSTAAQTEQTNTVQAVLFYSPTCPHCQIVIDQTMIPLVETHGDQLEILAFDVSQAGGQQFYQAAIVYFDIPDDRLGVPTLVVGDVILVGGAEIPDQFPAIIEEGLSDTGIPWPEIPGLAEALAGVVPEDNAGTDPTPTAGVDPTPQSNPAGQVEPTNEVAPPTQPATEVPEPSATAEPVIVAQATTVAAPPAAAETEPFVLVPESGEVLELESESPEADPVGFALAGLILMAMIAACGFVAWRIIAAGKDHLRAGALGVFGTRNWAIPILALAGLGVAAYLAYVEITRVEAICGPVGQCNIVQSSSYAYILGVPVALLGLVSYVAILVLWLAQKYLADRLGTWPTLGLMVVTIFGTLFSIYLTLLELFVIHAVCVWCLSSAVITLLLMLMIVVPATAEPNRQIWAAA